jgi:hypothetical protein
VEIVDALYRKIAFHIENIAVRLAALLLGDSVRNARKLQKLVTCIQNEQFFIREDNMQEPISGKIKDFLGTIGFIVPKTNVHVRYSRDAENKLICHVIIEGLVNE